MQERAAKHTGNMRALRGAKGQALVFFTVFLVVLLGLGSLAVDIGYIYYARATLKNAADAAALAGISGLVSGQDRAIQLAQQNFAANQAGNTILSTASLALSFPTANSIRAEARRSSTSGNALDLFLAPVIGISTADVEGAARVRYGSAKGIDPGKGGGIVPVAIMCNRPGNCQDVLHIGETFTMWRACGHFPETCSGDPIEEGDTFIQGIDIGGNGIGTAEFRDRTFCGCCVTGTCNWPKVGIGSVIQSLVGENIGWDAGMQDRLAEGRDEMIFPVITDQPADHSNNFAQVTIVDFVKVKVINFRPKHGNQPEEITFQIIPGSVEADEFNDDQDLDIYSLVTYKMIE